MSKIIKSALTVALALVVLGAVLVCVSLLLGANLRELWDAGSFQINPISGFGFGDLKDYTVCLDGEERFSPDEVRRIELGWISGKVTLQVGSRDRIELQERCSRSLCDDQKLCWKLENGCLYLRFCSQTQTRLFDKELVLTIPEGWTAEYFSIDAVSADLTLRGLTVEKKLSADTTSGEIRVEDCRADSLDANSVSGSIFVRGKATSFRLNTTSGDVRLQLPDAQGAQRIEVDTVSGDVYLDASGALDLDFDSVSGKLSGRLTQGGDVCPRVTVDTVSGDLILSSFQ